MADEIAGASSPPPALEPYLMPSTCTRSPRASTRRSFIAPPPALEPYLMAVDVYAIAASFHAPASCTRVN